MGGKARRQRRARSEGRRGKEGTKMGNAPSLVVTGGRVLIALMCSPLSAIAGCVALLISCPRRIWQALGGERPALAAILVAFSPVFSIPVGCVGGVLFGLLASLYGPSAPNKPFSLEPASSSRFDTPNAAEVEATELKKEYASSLDFETKQTSMTIGGRAHVVNYNVIKPRTKSKGVMIVQHGLHCHGGAPRSLKVGIHMALEEEYVVYLQDFIGHGRSSGDWAVVDSLEVLAEQLARFTAFCAAEHPSLPLILQGESMGGQMVLYAPHFMDEATLERLDGIIAVCPALMVHDDAGDPILEQFIRLWPMDILKSLLPKFPATPGPKGNIFSSDPTLNAAAQESVEKDPLEWTGNTLFSTATTFMQTLLDEEARKKLVSKLQTLEKPLLLQHGTADKCVDVACSREFLAGVRSKNKKLIEYEGKAHVLLSEEAATREKFLSDAATFANEVIQATKTF